ncbi:MAG: SEC-C metal-binding domain-containing protein [Pseudomonadota bacterium]
MSIGRNQPCPCGSGKKYKHCCLASGRFEPGGLKPAAAPAPRPAQQFEHAKAAFNRQDNKRAWRSLRPLLEAKEPYPGALGLACRLAMRERAFDKACEYGERALAQQPNNAATLYNFATAAANAGRQAEAIDCYERALTLNSGLVQVHHNLANTLRDVGRTGEALDHYRRAFDAGGLPLSTLGNVLLNIQLFCGDEHEELYQRHCRLGEILTERAPRLNTAAPHTRSDTRIRLGYLSPRFSCEIVGYFFKPIFDHHNRDEFELYLYSATPREDAMTAYFRDGADVWLDVANMDDAQLAQRIRDDGIDVLVDLAGHAPESRIGALAAKPAPIQISMLDYFDTTGLPAMDYFVSDRFSTPEQGPQRFSETLLYLDQPRLVYEAPDYAPEVAARDPDAPLVFGSFNRAHKIGPPVLEAWSKLLQAVPQARLLLKAGAFDSPDVCANLAGQFESRGISRERIEFRGASPHIELLAQYGDMDIALDTFPYNGGLTTCEALWMGVPVLTRLGQRLIGRQSGAMLSSVGLDDFVASSTQAFVDKGRHWANERAQLGTLRGQLRARMAAASLTDGASYTRDFESHLKRFMA